MRSLPPPPPLGGAPAQGALTTPELTVVILVVVVAAVLLSAPRYRTPRDTVSALGATCREAADAVSGRLGGRPWRG